MGWFWLSFEDVAACGTSWTGDSGSATLEQESKELGSSCDQGDFITDSGLRGVAGVVCVEVT